MYGEVIFFFQIDIGSYGCLGKNCDDDGNNINNNKYK